MYGVWEYNAKNVALYNCIVVSVNQPGPLVLKALHLKYFFHPLFHPSKHWNTSVITSITYIPCNNCYPHFLLSNISLPKYVIWMASCTRELTHIQKTMEIYVIDSFGHWFCYLFVVICIYSFYPVLHVAVRFFLKIVKMWVSPLVHDAIHLSLSVLKWNESGFRPPLCTYRLNWARRTSWGWWDDTVLQTLDSKFEPWRSEAEHATSRSRRLPTILTFTRGWGRNHFVSFKPPRPGTEPRTLAWKAAVLTTTLGPPPC